MSEDSQHAGPPLRSSDSFSRRSLISSVALAGAALAAGIASKAAGQTRVPREDAGRGKIDVHHHFLSDAYVRAIGRERIAAQSSSGTIPLWTPQLSLKLMDQNGIDTAFLSVSAPDVGMGTAAATARLARECNEAQARIREDHPGRFGVFAALPLPDVDATLGEIAYSFDTLKVDGVGMMTNYDGIHIGDPRFWPVFEELNRRNAIVCVHPTMPFNFVGVPNVSASTLEFPFETTRAIISIVVHGTAARFPDTRMIWPHAGGAISALAGRANVLSERHAKWVQKGPDQFLPALRAFYYDVTQSTSAGTFAALSAIASADHLLFGSDVPFVGQPQIDLTLTEMRKLDVKNLDGINRDNAWALLRSRG
jgi:predicted TIM-barrel fold metal-dependent hydrolase